MLDTIFDLLRTWTDTNLKSFQIQLNQFCQVYGDPFVYEEKQKKWYSLNYGEEDVRRMLKEFMLTKMIPQLLKDGDGKMLYIQDPMRAAVIMLHVWRQQQFKLDNAELYRLCDALSLPIRDQDDFLQYWTEFSQDVAFFKNLPVMLVHLIRTVKTTGMHRWILVLPLLHLLKGNIKPFEIPTYGNAKYGLSWAGLQGLDIGTSTVYMNSQER
uniref:E3 ubiquitin-protein ligase rnf213-alpha n=1 Tax=Epinephelus lanceolatus TaxID=310571 RepID=UPI00144549FE